MPKLKQSILSIVIGLALAAGISYAATWTGPLANPPDDNVPAPLNVGGSAQAKSGNLSVGTSAIPTVSLNVGGASNFTGVSQFLSQAIFVGKVTIADGTQGYGKVLASDKHGEATWQAPNKAIRIEFAQGFRGEEDGNGGTIYALKGPLSAFVAVDNASANSNSVWYTSKYNNKLDGIKCNDSEGWTLGSCWESRYLETDIDLIPYTNGCITNDYGGDGKTEVSISCIKIQ